MDAEVECLISLVEDKVSFLDKLWMLFNIHNGFGKDRDIFNLVRSLGHEYCDDLLLILEARGIESTEAIRVRR